MKLPDAIALILVLSPFVSAENVEIIRKDSLVSKLASLASHPADDVAGSCDLIFLPRDDGGSIPELTLDAFNTIEKFRTIVQIPTISQTLVEQSKCPLVVLPTSKLERLGQASLVAAGTRFPVSLAVITNDSRIREELNSSSWRATFDVYLLSEQGTGSYSLQLVLPSKNEAWKHITITYVPGDFYIRISPDGTKTGPDWVVLQVLAQRTGIDDYTFIKSHNSFVGMMDLVENGTADMAISQGSYEYGRYLRTGDVSAVYAERVFSLLARLPKEMAADWTIIYPFDYMTWILLLVSVIAVALALSGLNCESCMVNRHKIDGYKVFSISVITLISESLPHEWFDFRKFNRYGAILLFTWFPTGLLISFAYKSTLLASLVSVEFDDSIDTWQELLDNKMTLALPTHLIMYDLVAKSPRPIVQQVYRECVIGRDGAYTGRRPDWLNEKLDDGTAIRISTTGSLASRSHQYKWGDELRYTYTGSHFVKKFPWRVQQDQVINELVAGGIIRKLHNDAKFKWAKSVRDYERHTPVVREKKLTVGHFRFVMISTLLGCFVSGLCLAWEGVNQWIFGVKDEEEVSAYVMKSAKQANEEMPKTEV